MEMLFGNKGTMHYIDAKVNTVKNVEAMGEMFHIFMLENNEISHLWKPSVMYVDSMIWLRHNTEHHYVFERLLSQTDLNGEMFRQIMGQIFECIHELEEYMLCPDNLVIHTDYMFWNASKQDLKFIYLPGHKKDIRIQLKDFLERIMKQFDHKDSQGLELMYGSYGMVVDENLELSQLERYICGQKILPRPCEVEDMISSNVNSYNTIYETAPSNEELYEKADWENEATQQLSAGRILAIILLGCGSAWFLISYILFPGDKRDLFIAGVLLVAAVFLSMTKAEQEDEDDMAMRKYQSVTSNSISENRQSAVDVSNFYSLQTMSLVPLTNGALEPMTISNNEKTAMIGRGRQDTSYRLSASQISRLHAAVYMKGDSLFIKDCNSTNGTFINANRLEAGVEYQARKGDIVAFANEEFYVS